jgi:hypothetical protein
MTLHKTWGKKTTIEGTKKEEDAVMKGRKLRTVNHTSYSPKYDHVSKAAKILSRAYWSDLVPWYFCAFVLLYLCSIEPLFRALYLDPCDGQ